MFSNEVVDKPISMYSKPDELMSVQPLHGTFAYFEAPTYGQKYAFLKPGVLIGTVQSMTTFYDL